MILQRVPYFVSPSDRQAEEQPMRTLVWILVIVVIVAVVLVIVRRR
jgi:hypothetical protein